MDHLSAHLDQWTQLVGRYGQTLVQLVPEQHRTDLLAIIPDELENERARPPIERTCQDLHANH